MDYTFFKDFEEFKQEIYERLELIEDKMDMNEEDEDFDINEEIEDEEETAQSNDTDKLPNKELL